MKKNQSPITIGILVALFATIVYAMSGASDTDGGFNIYEEGTCTYYNETNQSNISKTDFCHNQDYLVEFYPDSLNDVCLFDFVDCRNEGFSFGCRDNICRHFARDTDGGYNLLEQGVCTYQESNGSNISQTEYCDGNTNIEAYPDPTDENVCIIDNVDCSTLGENYICKLGACTPQPPCTDTDGGLDYFTQGTANNSINGSVTDFCGSGVVLFEAYCDENDLVQTQYKNCEDFGQYSCTNGACVGYATDTDGGINKNVKGTCTDKNEDDFTDYCQSSTYLKEYYPGSGGVCSLTTINCGISQHCLFGKCVPLEER
jgi:hypothetical protein